MNALEQGTTADTALLLAYAPLHVEQTQKHYRWNFACFLIDGAFFGLTLSFVSEQTLVPYLVTTLSGSAWIGGLVPTLRYVGLLGPQLLASYWVHSRSSKKRLVWWMGFAERATLILLILALIQWNRLPSALVLVIFLACYGLFYLTNGMMAPGYQDLIAKNIVRGRGVLFGLNRATAGVMVIGASFLITWAIQSYAFPQSFVVIFIFALALSIPSLIAFSLLRETPYQGVPVARPLNVFLSEIPRLLAEQFAFRRYLVLRGLLGVGAMGTPFIATFALNRLGFPTISIGAFTTVMVAAQYLGALAAGWLGDRLGFKRVIVLVALLLPISYLPTLMDNPQNLIFVSFLGAGLSIGGLQVSDNNYVLEVSPPEETPRFIGIANTFLTPAIALAPVLAGLIAERSSFHLMFDLAFIVSLGAFILILFRLDEPRAYHLRGGV